MAGASANGNRVIGHWKSFTFLVTKKQVRTFTDLTLKGSVATEEKKRDGAGYVVKKNTKPYELSLTVKLNANLGCNVLKDAKKLVRYAHKGYRGYFYIGMRKLISCWLMLTDATVENVMIGSRGAWLSADVKLTLKQTKKAKKKPPHKPPHHTSSPTGSGSPTTTSSPTTYRPPTSNSTNVVNNAHIETTSNLKPPRPNKPTGGMSVGTTYNMYR